MNSVRDFLSGLPATLVFRTELCRRRRVYRSIFLPLQQRIHSNCNAHAPLRPNQCPACENEKPGHWPQMRARAESARTMASFPSVAINAHGRPKCAPAPNSRFLRKLLLAPRLDRVVKLKIGPCDVAGVPPLCRVHLMLQAVATTRRYRTSVNAGHSAAKLARSRARPNRVAGAQRPPPPQ